MRFFNKSIIGKHHIKKNIPCQDFSYSCELETGDCLLIVADGVGSAKRAEIGSENAVKSLADSIKKSLSSLLSSGNKASNEIYKTLLLDGFKAALSRVEEISTEEQTPINEYDTTLTAVIFNGKEIVYCHSGDGGVIGLLESGEYIAVTKKQKDSDGIAVIPLRGGSDSWESGISEGPFVSVLLATDGIYDTFFPYLLKDSGKEIYIPLIRYFLDNSILKPSNDYREFFADKIDFIESESYEQVQDDKTIAIAINEHKYPKLLDESYYSEPNWDELELAWKKKAYPHLFDKKEE